MKLFVHVVPSDHPYFDLEMTFVRTAGAATTMNVSLSVIRNNNGTGTRQTFGGTVAVPAAGPVPVSRLVTWTDGDSIDSAYGGKHRMPRFYAPPSGSNGVADVQPLQIQLSTATAIDEPVSILSLRFSFYRSA